MDVVAEVRGGRAPEEGKREMASRLSIGKRSPLRRRALAAVIAMLALLPGSPSQANSAPANTLRELFAELNQCLVPPKGTVGSELTIIFSLRRSGALLGKPRITFAKLLGDAAEQRKFADGVGAAFNRCLPLAITDALGGAIAGRPLSMRFVVRPRETDT